MILDIRRQHTVLVIFSQSYCCLLIVNKVFGRFSHNDKFIPNVENRIPFCHLLLSRCLVTAEVRRVLEGGTCYMCYSLAFCPNEYCLNIKLSFHLLISPYVDKENHSQETKWCGSIIGTRNSVVLTSSCLASWRPIVQLICAFNHSALGDSLPSHSHYCLRNDKYFAVSCSCLHSWTRRDCGSWEPKRVWGSQVIYMKVYFLEI